MKLIKEIRENAALLTLKGEFDSFVVGPFMEEIKALFKNDVKFLIIDMRLVLFINSTAIGTLVKIHKETKAEGGRLILSRPSNFVNGVLDSLGLMSVFTITDDPEKAMEELVASTTGTDVGEEGSVIIRLPGKGTDTCIGKMSVLDESGMTIRLSEPRDELAAGTECEVKFRLPLFRKGHYFTAGVEISGVEGSGSDTRLRCAIKKIGDEDRKAIAQFVEEMKFLRSEARKKE
jgi:anti-anti-sigma factor